MTSRYPWSAHHGDVTREKMISTHGHHDPPDVQSWQLEPGPLGQFPLLVDARLLVHPPLFLQLLRRL